MQLDAEFADVCDHIRVITVALNLGVNPRARAFTHEADGVGNGFAGDAQINGRLNQLRHRALNIRAFVESPVVDHQVSVNPHIVEQHGAAGSRALTKT